MISRACRSSRRRPTTAPLIMGHRAVVSDPLGAFMAIASKDLMRLVAYTSVSHFGFIVPGVFSGGHTAMTGPSFMVAHGVPRAPCS